MKETPAMSPDQPANLEEPSAEANSGGVIQNSPPRSPQRPNSHRKVWLALLVFGVPMSALAWVAGELAFTYFVAPTKEVSAMGMTMHLATRDDQILAESRNETIAFGVMGALLGLAFGIAGGWVGGSARLSISGGFLGLLIGGAIGAGATRGALPFYNPYRDENTPDLLPVTVLHLVVFGGIGAACGLAFGIGSGEKYAWLKAMLGGLIGAFVGTVIAECLAAVLFPTDKTNLPVSITAMSRLLYRAVLGLAIIAGLGLAVADPRRSPSKSH